MDSKERDKKVNQPDVPFVTYERAEAAYERHIKRYWILCIVLLALLVISNGAWLCFISSFDFENYEYQQDGSGINIIGDENKEVTYNGTENKSKEDDAEERSEGQDETCAGENG